MKKTMLRLIVIALAVMLTVPALAQDREDGDKGDREKSGIDIDVIIKAFKEAGMTDEQIRPALGGMRRVIVELKEWDKEDGDFKLSEELQKYFEDEVGLTEEQIKLVIGCARRLAWSREDSDRRRGEKTDRAKKTDPLDWLPKALKERGELTDEQLRPAMLGLRRVMGELGKWNEEDGDFELSEELRKYFEDEVGLNEEQIELVINCARRALLSLKDTDRKRDDKAEQPSSDWVPKVLKERGELTDEQLRATMGGLRRVMHELKEWNKEDGDFELSEGLRKYFEDEVGLTEEQIKLVIGCASRLAYSRENVSDRKRGEKTDKAGEKKPERTREVDMADIFKRLGVDDVAFAELQKALKDAELSDEQIEKALGGILRIAYGVKAAGDDEYELDERMKKYLEDEVGLTDEQIEEVVKLAKRIAEGLPERGNERGRGR
ncbi:MAG: hypothetical protein E3J72_18575 [Planctomycetota bacterium]|nr:MAG: hypothetical protein E3J72_18575 [Planctomycetota bacterium]